MIRFLRERPWIWVVALFLCLITAWTFFFRIALRNQPERVPLEHLQEAVAEGQPEAGNSGNAPDPDLPP